MQVFLNGLFAALTFAILVRCSRLYLPIEWHIYAGAASMLIFFAVHNLLTRFRPPRRPTVNERGGRLSPPNPTLKANREWLAAHRMEYRGQWIALRNGELLATGASIEEVESQIKDVPRRVDGHLQVLMTRA